MKKIPYLILFLCCFNSCIPVADEPLQVGISIWPTNDFFILAKKLGYYQGQNIHLINYNTPSEMIRAYRTGLLDAILTTNYLFINKNEDELNDRIIMAVDCSDGSDVMLLKQGLSSVEELRGKRIGAESSALGIYVLRRFLEVHELEPEDITHVSIDQANQFDAFKKGIIEGVVTCEPYATRIRKTGAVEFCNSKLIPYEISDILACTQNTIEKKQDQLSAFCLGFGKYLTIQSSTV